jgi:hypothetical protein
LCDLEGKTRKEAARQIGCPEGTVAGRLARARTMLAKRLTRHGLVLSGGALGAALSPNAASASVPISVVSFTIRTASLLAAGQSCAMISVEVAALTEGVLKTMSSLTKPKIAMTVLLAAFALTLGIPTVVPRTSAQDQPKVSTEGNKSVQRRWEYKTLVMTEMDRLTKSTVMRSPQKRLTDNLNALGEEGWELAGIEFSGGISGAIGVGGIGGGGNGGSIGGGGINGGSIGGGGIGGFGGAPSYAFGRAIYIFKREKK